MTDIFTWSPYFRHGICNNNYRFYKSKTGRPPKINPNICWLIFLKDSENQTPVWNAKSEMTLYLNIAKTPEWTWLFTYVGI